MKTPRFLVLLLAAFLTVLAPRPAQASVEVSFDFFYDSLSPYGEWIEIADYGICWRPRDADRDWAPYADGYWAFTDAGWTWVSYEDFGGIVYHYGRWIFVQDEGWCWVPEYEWGPAWVSWRQSDDYVGWAPLPPEARWEPEVGLSIWVDRQYDIGPGYYNFCRVRDFGAPVLRPVIVNRVENVTIIRRTVNITNITYNTHFGDRRVIYNGGLNYDAINHRSERRVPALKLVVNGSANLPGGRDWDRDGARDDGRRRSFNGRVSGNQLLVTAPSVKRRSDADSQKPKITKVVAADKVTRGWNGVKNEEVRRELRQEMQRQTRGLTPQTTPAKPVAAAELAAVPEKADPKAPSPTATREKRGTAAQPPAPRTADQPARERGREPAPRESQQQPIAGQPGLEPFTPVEQPGRPEKSPGLTAPAAPAPDARVARPGEATERVRDGRIPADRNTAATAPVKPAGGRRGEMKGPPADISAPPENVRSVQDASRRKQVAEATAEQQRIGEMQRKIDSQRQQSEEVARQKLQADQEKVAREQTEAAGRQKQMGIERKAESLRQPQRDDSAAGERERMQVEAGRDARQQAEAAEAQHRQMAAQQRAAEEAARAREVESGRQEMESRRQQAEQAAEQQQRGKAMEQQRAAQDALRQQAEHAAEGQRRQRQQAEAEGLARRAQEGQREQMRQQAEADGQARRAQEGQREQMRQQAEAEGQARRAQEGQREQMRQQAEAEGQARRAQEGQREQMRQQAEAEGQARRAQEGQREQMRQQAEAEGQARRAQEGQREQMRQQAEAEGQARRAQEGQREQMRQQAEAEGQARRAQEGQREQMRQQAEAQRAQREAQRAAEPAPNAAPPSAPPAPERDRRGRDRKD